MKSHDYYEKNCYILRSGAVKNILMNDGAKIGYFVAVKNYNS